MKQRMTLNYKDAEIAIDAIKTELISQGKAVVIVVVDMSGELLALLRLDDVSLTSIQVAINKAWSVIRTRRPTLEIGKRVRDPEKGFDIAYYGDTRIVGWGGGIPVIVNGEIVGAVAVSGLTEVEDTAMAEIGVSAIIRSLNLPEDKSS